MNIEKSCGKKQNPKGEGLQKMDLGELRSVLQAIDPVLYKRSSAGSKKRLEICKLISQTTKGKKYFNAPAAPAAPAAKASNKPKATGPMTKKEIENLLNNLKVPAKLPKKATPPKNGNFIVNISNLGLEFDENSGEVVNVFQMNAATNNNNVGEVNYGNENGKYANVVFDPRNRRNRRTEKDPLRVGVLTKAQAKLLEPKPLGKKPKTQVMAMKPKPAPKLMSFTNGNRRSTNATGGLVLSTRPRFNAGDMRNARAIAGRMVNAGVNDADKAMAAAINRVMNEKMKGVRESSETSSGPKAGPIISFNLTRRPNSRLNVSKMIKERMVKKEPEVRKPVAKQLQEALNQLPGAKVVVKK